LIAASVPIGYAGLAVGAFIALLQRRPVGALLGIAIYLCSWGLTGLGAALAGRGAFRRARIAWRRRSR